VREQALARFRERSSRCQQKRLQSDPSLVEYLFYTYRGNEFVMSCEYSEHEWSHAPTHQFVPGASYFVTAGTYKKAPIFDSTAKRDFLLQLLFAESQRCQWRLEAWAVMANHYHFVALAPQNAASLTGMPRTIHAKSAVWVNKEDGTSGRKVWQQFWDTCLTHETSYWARLNYVHSNPVKHGLAKYAEDYR